MGTEKFSKNEVIQLGWEITKKNFWFLIFLMVLMVAINLGISLLALFSKFYSPFLSFIVLIAGWVLSIEVSFLGFTKIILKLCNNGKSQISELFSQFPLFFKALGGLILYYLIVLVGACLLVIPGIIWAIKYQFFIYFIIDKKLGPLQALRRSGEITQGVKWDLFAFGLMIFGINLLGFFCLIIGLFVSVPATALALALVYRKFSAEPSPAVAPVFPKKSSQPSYPERAEQKIFRSKPYWPVLILVAVIVLGVSIYIIFAGDIEMPSYQNMFWPEREADETADWQTYRNEELGFEIKYPGDIVKLTEGSDGIALNHSIPFEHQDPCDWKGDGSIREEFTDFAINISVVNKNLRGTIAEEKLPLGAEYFIGDKPKTEPGFIDEIIIDSREGYIISIGAEGCGNYYYIIPLDSENTLFVTRAFITELMPIISDYQRYWQLPGVITPVKGEKLFLQIINTFRFKEEVNTLNYESQEALMREILVRANPEILNSAKFLGPEYWKVFYEIPSPYSDKTAVAFGLDPVKAECCGMPVGLFFIIRGKLGDNYKILNGALEHLYLENIIWVSEDSISYDVVTADEGGEYHKKEYLEAE